MVCLAEKGFSATFATFIFLLFLAIFAFLTRQLFFSFIFLFSAFVYLLAKLITKTFSTTKRMARAGAKVAKSELKKVSEAQTSFPEGVLSETLKEVGRKTGEAVFDEYGAWSSGETSKEFRAKLGKSTKNFINKFLGLFK